VTSDPDDVIRGGQFDFHVRSRRTDQGATFAVIADQLGCPSRPVTAPLLVRLDPRALGSEHQLMKRELRAHEGHLTSSTGCRAKSRDYCSPVNACSATFANGGVDGRH